MPDKWYLNMPKDYDDGTQKSRSGTLVELIAKPTLAIRFATNPQVNWTVSYANAPDAHADYVVAPRFTSTQSPYLNQTFRTSLRLPVVNGRTYTIEARRAGNNAQVFNKQYETWQRIYLTVHYMNNECRDAFNAIKNDLIQLFATANIELKVRKVLQCRKNGQNIDQEFTTTQRGVTLPHTWDDNDAPLDRAPNHIRMVVTRDLCAEVDGGVEWTMTNATTANPDRKIRISSSGSNHSVITYENDIATFDRTRPFSGLTVRATLAPLPLPGTCVAFLHPDRPHQSLRVNLSSDPVLGPILTRFNNGEKIAISGTLRGRRCEQGWERQYSHETRATLSKDHTEQAPATVGSAKLWIAGGDTLVIDDPRMFLDATTAAEAVAIKYEQTEVKLASNTVTRVSDHRLSVALGGNEGITKRLDDGESIELSLKRRGALALGDSILDPADYAFEFKKRCKSDHQSATSGELTSSVTQNGLTLQASKIAITGTDALIARFVNFTAPIPVPDGVIRTDSEHHAEINLAADATLAVVAQAMQGGRAITFKGNFNGRESLGGYSPTRDRWFIALNTRALPGWDRDIVRRRLKLTVAHEIGHSLQLVQSSVQNRRTNTLENNDRWYDDDHGGQGPHCHLNAQLVAAGAANGFEDTPSGQLYRWDPQSGGKLCIMYHAIDHDNIGDVFCDRCTAHLKRGVCNFGQP